MCPSLTNPFGVEARDTPVTLNLPALWLTSATNPENGTVSYTYNADGTLASKKDANGNTETYTYDAYQRLTGIPDRQQNGTTSVTGRAARQFGFFAARFFSRCRFSRVSSLTSADLGTVSTLRNAMSRRSAGLPPSGMSAGDGNRIRFHHTALSALPLLKSYPK